MGRLCLHETAVAALAGGLVAVLPASVDAQSRISLSGDRFSETYLEDPPISGNLLVGVQWQVPSAFDPNSVGLDVTHNLSGAMACLALASKDGRYAAENLYWIAPGINGPAPFYLPTRYTSRLRHYSWDNMAVLVRKVTSCDVAETGIIVPALIAPWPPDMPKPHVLVFDVNADADRVSLRLTTPGGVLQAVCMPAGGDVMIAFSTRCSVTVLPDLKSSVARVTLDVQEHFRLVETPYSVLINGPS